MDGYDRVGLVPGGVETLGGGTISCKLLVIGAPVLLIFKQRERREKRGIGRDGCENRVKGWRNR